MASEETAKRFLCLAGYWPKGTREPRGPEHMAKMKAARGPYSDPRDTYIARTIRYAFESSRGKPLSTGQLVKEIYGLQLRVERKPLSSWHYQNVRRALRKVAIPIGRASTRGRSVLWRPDERTLAEKRCSTVPIMVGHRLVGTSLLYTGDIAEGRAHLDRDIGLYDPREHRLLRLVLVTTSVWRRLVFDHGPNGYLAFLRLHSPMPAIR